MEDSYATYIKTEEEMSSAINKMWYSEIDHSCKPAVQLKSFEHDHSYCVETPEQPNESVDIEDKEIKLEYDIVSIKCEINTDFIIESNLDERYINDIGNQERSNNISPNQDNGNDCNETFQCSTCSKCFTEKNKCESHEKTHSVVKPFQCSQCGRGFTYKKPFTQHMKNHTFTTRFQCLVCARDYSSASNLRKHKLTKHSNRADCSVCGESIAKSQLKKHMQIHEQGHDPILEKPRQYDATYSDINQSNRKRTLVQESCTSHGSVDSDKRQSPETWIKSEIDYTMEGSMENQKLINIQPTHSMEDNGNDAHKCHMCTYTAESTDDLQIHIEEHTEDHKNEHEITEEEMEVHREEDMEEHSIDIPFQCTICSSIFTRKCQFKQHMRKHECEKSFRCEVCGMGFTTSDGLTSHICTQNCNDTFQTCGKDFTEKTKLECHEDTDDDDEDDVPYRCLECGKCFDYRSSFSKHMKTHTPEKQCQCPMCDQKFSNSSQLRNHKRRSHSQRVDCSVCGKNMDEHNLKKHIRIHVQGYKSTPHKVHQCDVCGGHFINMWYHRMTHTGEKNIQCSVCDRRFRNRTNYRTHMRTHTGEQPYSCDVCHRKFSKQQRLRLHKRTHTGEKPFQCTECDKCFARQDNLTLHMRMHTGERPFSCSKCGVRFASKSGLNSHTKVHTSDKPYKCVVCGASFMTDSNLQRHWQSTHR